MTNKTGKGVESMTTVKRFFYGGAATLLALPVAVFAEFKVPTGTNLPGDAGAAGDGIIGIMTSIMQWLLILVGILAIIAFVIAGIMYLTSMGDEGRAESAKKAMIYAVFGVVVALLGLIVLNFVNNLLSGQGEFST